MSLLTKKLGWKENPFTLKINPLLFTGYKSQIEAVKRHLEEDHKISLIIGPTGSGKTSILKWFESNLDNYTLLYISKPPKKSEEFIGIFIDIFRPGLLEKLFSGIPTLFNLPKYINKKLRGKLLIMVDEAHETDKEVLEWLRVIIDQIENVSLIMAGLPVLDRQIKEKLETLDQRITSRIYLNSLSESETKELIKKRIESVGGIDIKPFTDEAIVTIYNRTGGFPREIIKMCDKMLMRMVEMNTNVIDQYMIEDFREFEKQEMEIEPSVTFIPKPPSENKIKSLPYKQKKVLDIVAKGEWMTPPEIFDSLESHSYKTRGHGIRSINNILHRLMLDGFIQRESRGKSFMYSITPKVKTLLVEK